MRQALSSLIWGLGTLREFPTLLYHARAKIRYFNGISAIPGSPRFRLLLGRSAVRLYAHTSAADPGGATGFSPSPLRFPWLRVLRATRPLPIWRAPSQASPSLGEPGPGAS